jgi:dihydroxyacetone kinase phosphoprotein-dependent L subunit
MEELDAKDTVLMLLYVCDALIDAEEELCRLDSYVGDGDHGITISRGFQAVREKIREHADGDDLPGRLFVLAGDTLSETMGGAAGPIIGGMFCAMGEALRGHAVIRADIFSVMLESALHEAEMTGESKPGDRTLIDALFPAVEAAKQACQTGVSLQAALEAAAEGARRGAEETRHMTARKGRAKFLGEKSLGYQDAGAVSVCRIIASMASYCRHN